MSGMQRFFLGIIMVSLLFGSRAARADWALIVAVDKYPQLQDADLEDAGVNSAPLVKSALEARGFDKTKVLLNQEATRSGILGALQEIGSAIQPGERFVFYFLGHGGRNFEKQVLMPYDATMNPGSPDLDKETLTASLRTIRAKGCATTALLESCFSGGMIESGSRLESLHRGRRALYFERPRLEGQRENIVRVNGPDQPSDICYFVASEKTEQAYADYFDDQKMYGVFTVYLTQQLKGATPAVWGDVHQEVSSSVSKKTDDIQHPVLSDGWHKFAPFGNRVGPKPGPTQDLEELFNTDRDDRTLFHLDMTPNKAQLGVMELFSFRTQSSKDGYLVLMSRTADGSMEVLFPVSKQAEDAYIEAGKSRRLPESGDYAADRAGTERAKAFLFPTKAAAEEVLAKFRATSSVRLGSAARLPGADRTGKRAMDIKIVPGTVQSFTTYGITLEIKGK